MWDKKKITKKEENMCVSIFIMKKDEWFIGYQIHQNVSDYYMIDSGGHNK